MVSRRRARWLTLWMLGAATGAGRASGQLVPASAGVEAVGGVAAATARGFDALGANPAGLAMSGTGRYSLALLPVVGRAGLAPVSLGDLADWDGDRVPAAVKEAWLQRVEAAGAEDGGAALGAAPFSLQVGRVAFQASTVAGGEVHLNPDAVELLLFGNAGRTGQTRDFELRGSSLQGWVVSTAGIAYAVPLKAGERTELAVGAVATVSVGHEVVVGRDVGSSIEEVPVEAELQFPVLVGDTDAHRLNRGSGVGLDLGVAWRRDRLQLGTVLHNAFNTFAWDLERLEYRPGHALFEGGDTDSDFEPRPAAEAPAALREAVDDLGFAPVLALGAGYRLRPDLVTSADLRLRLGDGMDLHPRLETALGVEARAARWLALRAHAGPVTGGFRIGGGASVMFGSFAFGGAVGTRLGEAPDDDVTAMVSLSWRPD